MKVIHVTSIREMLFTSVFKGNESKLSKFLKINRGTLRNYVDDIQTDHHIVIRTHDNRYIVMNLVQPNKKEKQDD